MFHTDVRVRYEETDQGGVVYHANYLRYLEVARVELLRARGVDYARWERDGLRLLVVEAHLRFRAPARFDDLLRIHIERLETGAARIDVHYEVRQAAEPASPEGEERRPSQGPLVTAHTVHACVDASGRPRRLPPALADALRGTP